MGFRQQEQKKVVQEPQKLSNTQLDIIEREIEMAGGEVKWLEFKKAIRIDKRSHCGFSVIVNQNGEIPYEIYSEQARQVSKRKHRRDWAKREEIYRQTGEYPISPALQKFKESIGKLNKNI